MTVKKFLTQRSGDICLMSNDGSVYCSFRENVPLELMGKEMKKIELDKKDVLITI